MIDPTRLFKLCRSMETAIQSGLAGADAHDLWAILGTLTTVTGHVERALLDTVDAQQPN